MHVDRAVEGLGGSLRMMSISASRVTWPARRAMASNMPN